MFLVLFALFMVLPWALSNNVSTKPGLKIFRDEYKSVTAACLDLGLQSPGGGLEVSQLCHKKMCVNPMHRVVEAHATKLERLHSRNQEVCCRALRPYCLL